MLTTSAGRIYQFTLDSEPYPAIERTQNPTDIPYTAHVKFYYPEEGSPDGLLSLTGGFSTDPYGLSGTSAFVDPNGLPLNTASYVIEADPGFPCPPISAGDNGTHLRLHFPDHSDGSTAPSGSRSTPSTRPARSSSSTTPSRAATPTSPTGSRPRPACSTGPTRATSARSRSATRRCTGRAARPAWCWAWASARRCPASSAPFRDTYAPGLDLTASLGVRTSRSFTLGVEAGVQSLGANGAFLDGAVEYGLNETLAPALASRLRSSGALGADESVVLFARGSQADVRTLRLSAVGRLSLAPSARIEPYLGARVGVLRRTATAATYQASGLVVGADGARRPSAALDAQIERASPARPAAPARPRPRRSGPACAASTGRTTTCRPGSSARATRRRAWTSAPRSAWPSARRRASGSTPRASTPTPRSGPAPTARSSRSTSASAPTSRPRRPPLPATEAMTDRTDPFDDAGDEPHDFRDDPFADVRADTYAADPDDPFDLEPVLDDDEAQNTPNSYNVRNIVLIASGGFVLVLVVFLFSMSGDGTEAGRLQVSDGARHPDGGHAARLLAPAGPGGPGADGRRRPVDAPGRPGPGPGRLRELHLDGAAPDLRAAPAAAAAPRPRRGRARRRTASSGARPTSPRSAASGPSRARLPRRRRAR